MFASAGFAAFCALMVNDSSFVDPNRSFSVVTARL